MAKAVLCGRTGHPGPWPSYFLPDTVARAREKLAHAIELEVGNT